MYQIIYLNTFHRGKVNIIIKHIMYYVRCMAYAVRFKTYAIIIQHNTLQYVYTGYCIVHRE